MSVAHAMSRLNAVKFDEYNGHGRIINNNNYEATMPDKVITPKDAMRGLANLEALKEALAIFFQKNSTKELSNNIKTVPTFFEPQVERVELSDDTKATFARIGARARREFIEEQTARAYQYNIPYDVHNVNFFELKQKIDKYEELLKKAKDETVKIINIAGEKMSAKSMSTDLAQKIFEMVGEIGELPTEIALDYVKKEFQELL